MSHDFESYRESGFKVLDNIFKNKDIKPEFLKYKNRAYAMRYKYLARRYFENFHMQSARLYIKKALSLNFSLAYKSSIALLYIFSFLSFNKIKFIKNFKNNI